MKSLARGYVWWPVLDAEVEDMVKKCDTCQSLRNLPPETPLHPWVRTSRPMERVHMDFADYKNQSFLIIIDSYSKWLKEVPMKSTTTQSTIEKLRFVFASTGLPEVDIVSDNGPQFKAAEFREFCSLNGIYHKFIPPYHPSSNGQAERTVQIVKHALRARLKNNDKRVHSVSVNHLLADFLLNYRITPHTTTGVESCVLFQGRQLRSQLSLTKPDKDGVVKKKQTGMKDQHDHPVKMREFVNEDLVAVKTNTTVGKWHWIPGVIHNVLGKVTYLVKLSSKIRYCHADHLSPRHLSMEMSSDSYRPFFESDVGPVLGNQVTSNTPVPRNTCPAVESATPLEVPTETNPIVEATSPAQKSPNQPVVPTSPRTFKHPQERRYPQRVRRPPKKLDL
ncbi:uncharacterized protein K02A2.6-like [Dreissena polymorpha]|uniref:uncharacterized protein K02A2.6-like n=1 Tax=Dreissena polymorpha TaxID=45954 RepID=UPI002263AF31|nr:uncharacterized protein K02A2.6-like [Dreissena polymorpha]